MMTPFKCILRYTLMTCLKVMLSPQKPRFYKQIHGISDTVKNDEQALSDPTCLSLQITILVDKVNIAPKQVNNRLKAESIT